MNYKSKINIDITLNDTCNMNCSYCNSNKYSKNQYITHKSFKYELEKIKKLPINDINITLLGGEVTLLDANLLKLIINDILRINKNIRLHIFTNLKLFSKELKELYLRNKNIYLIVSIDAVDDSISDRNITFNEIVTNLSKYEDMSRIIVNSVLLPIRMDTYYKLVDTISLIGIDKFRIKIESFILDRLNNLNLISKIEDELTNIINYIYNKKCHITSLMYLNVNSSYSRFIKDTKLEITYQLLTKQDGNKISNKNLLKTKKLFKYPKGFVYEQYI